MKTMWRVFTGICAVFNGIACSLDVIQVHGQGWLLRTIWLMVFVVWGSLLLVSQSYNDK